MVKSDAAWPTYLPKNLTSYVNAPHAKNNENIKLVKQNRRFGIRESWNHLMSRSLMLYLIVPIYIPRKCIIVQITLIWIERILETKMYWSVTVKSNSYQIMWVSSVGYLEFTTLWQYWLWHFMFYRCWNLKNVPWISFFPSNMI